MAELTKEQIKRTLNCHKYFTVSDIVGYSTWDNKVIVPERPFIVIDALALTGQRGSPSVCGVKLVAVYIHRRFVRPDQQSTIVIPCALEFIVRIDDSMVHYHAQTEWYRVVSGEGWMYFYDPFTGKEWVVELHPGMYIEIRGGLHHGAVSKKPGEPIVVHLTFPDGLGLMQPEEEGTGFTILDYAPYRDERITHLSAREQIVRLGYG